MKIFILLMILATTQSHAKSVIYKILKNQILNLEESIIVDFNFQIPKDYQSANFNSTRAIDLGSKMEFEFNKQKENFDHVDFELAEIRSSLNKYYSTKEISQKEYNSLANDIEYALRIILLTRKNEVSTLHNQYKKSLYYFPKIESVFQKLKGVKLPGRCKMKQLSFDKALNKISFYVIKSPEDQKPKAHFTMTQNDFESKSMSYIHKHTPAAKRPYSIETYFQKYNKDDSSNRLHILEDAQGNLIKASFYQNDVSTHLFSFAGFKFGEQKESFHISCVNDN